MSESHDIEQIARGFAAAEFARPWERLGESERAHFISIARKCLPLIASAREEGAKSMQERAAAKVASVTERYRRGFAVGDTTDEDDFILSFEHAVESIKRLPLKEPA